MAMYCHHANGLLPQCWDGALILPGSHNHGLALAGQCEAVRNTPFVLTLSDLKTAGDGNQPHLFKIKVSKAFVSVAVVVKTSH